MPWFCPNEKCPNIEDMKQFMKCPVCHRDTSSYGTFLRPSIESILNKKNEYIKKYSIKKCSNCGNIMLPIIDDTYNSTVISNPEMFMFQLPQYYFQTSICLTCLQANIDNLIDKIHMFKGKLVSGVDSSTGFFRIRIEEPFEKRGIHVFKIPRYKTLDINEKKEIYLKRGDSIILCGYLEKNNDIVPVYYKNISGNYEGSFLGVFSKCVILLSKLTGDKNNKQALNFSNPLIIRSKELIKKENVSINMEPIKNNYHKDSTSFELLIAELFEKLGYEEVYVTGGAGDLGVDITVYKISPLGTKQRYIVQCKHQNTTNLIKPSQIRDFAHVINREKENDNATGFFITSSYFSPECYKTENCGKDMELIDRDKLTSLLNKVNLKLLDS